MIILRQMIVVVAMQGKPSLSAVNGNPEAENLLVAMLQPEAKQRPSMEAVMAHPFWWRHERRLAFLLQVSDRVELEDREVRPSPAACLFEGPM